MDATFVWLAALILRSTVVLSAALGLAWLLHRSSAAARHRLLTVTAVGLLALPVLTGVLPPLELPLGLSRSEPSSAALAPAPRRRAVILEVTEAGIERIGTLPAPLRAGAAPAANESEIAGRASQRRVSSRAFGAAAVTAWLLGALAAIVALGRSLVRERRLLASSRLLSGPWLETLDESRRASAVARPVRLLVSDAIDAPLTGGWLRPAVLLPPIAESWDADRRRVVLQHELVHVARGDGLRRMAWRLVAVLYWFHPLARIAKRQAGLAAEQACDEAVVRLGTQPSHYARHLVEIADGLRDRPAAFASALPMVERNQLERRVVMILDASRSSRRGRGASIASLVVLAATVACAAAAAPAQREGEAAPADAGEGEAARATASPGSSSTTVQNGENHSTSLQHDFEDGRRIRARVVGDVQFDDRTGAIREMPRGSSVSIETRGPERGSQRMRITEERGEPRYEWRLNGETRPVDADARAWLAEALEVFAAYRAIGSIRGHVGSLQGHIGSIQGEIGSLQGRIGAIQGEEGSLQGQIGSIQGEIGSLEGEIGSHQGAIGNLQAGRSSASNDLRKRIDREIREHEAAIRELEAKRDDGTFARRLEQAERELRAFRESSRGKIQELERQIAAIESENEIGRLEKEIENFRAEERVSEIERRVAPAVERLGALMRKLGG